MSTTALRRLVPQPAPPYRVRYVKTLARRCIHARARGATNLWVRKIRLNARKLTYANPAKTIVLRVPNATMIPTAPLTNRDTLARALRARLEMAKSGSGCTEIDGCKPAPCATLPSGGYGTAPTCTDKKSPQTGATCSNCPAGYNAQPTKPSYGGRGVCTDKNDCSSNPCGPAFAKCDEGRAGTGLYTCKCTTNFVSSNNKQGFPYCFVDPKIPGDILKANGAANPSCTSSFSDKALVDELIKLCPKCGIKKL